MQPVESSFITAIGHDAKRSVLHVEMKNGDVYEYPDVSAEAHKNLVGAESIGEHFGKNIRGKDFFRRHAPKKPAA